MSSSEPPPSAAGERQLQVRDLWLHKDMGAFGAVGYTATVGRHDVVAIRVSNMSRQAKG